MATPKWMIIVGCLTISISCKKSNQTIEQPNLAGNWVFAGLEDSHTATTEYLENAHKTTYVTFYSYTSTSNQGNVTITGDSILGSAIGFSYDLFLRTTFYSDNILSSSDSITIPQVDTAANSIVKFEYVGTDSIHFVFGTLTGSNGSGTSLTTGARFSLVGDELTLTSDIYFQDTTNINGLVGLAGRVVTKLKKQ